jgi:hypothetical protein
MSFLLLFGRRLVDQIDAPLMTAAFERLPYPFAHNFKSQVNAGKAGPKAQNVTVIMTAAHARFERLATGHGPHPRDPVGRYAHSGPAAAHQDAPICQSIPYRSSDSKGIDRVIDRIGTVRTNVHYLDVRLSERASDKLLQRKTGVIRTDEYFHKNTRLHSARTLYEKRWRGNQKK